MLREGTFLQDRYEIISRIGSGGMSDVYKSRDRKLNRLVAVKVLKDEFGHDNDFVRKFKMEAQAAAGLSHPNVVNVYDVVDEGSLHYIVMELVEGITLKDFIKSKGRLGLKETLGISIQVAQGIGAAHDQHIIHRDIKPQNIIISGDGTAKVADFGIARVESSETVNASAIGSVHYMSPEMAKGEYSDERSDIYSLGITIFEMITGKLPYEGDTSVSIALAHIGSDMPLASDFNPESTPELDNIILKCCQKKPERRYQRVEQVLADLRKALTMQQKPVPIEDEDDTDGHTRVLTPQEVGEINARAKVTSGKTQSARKSGGRKARRDLYDYEDENDSSLDKVLTIGGIILAVIVVAAVVWGILKFSGTIGSSADQINNALDVVSGDITPLSDKETYVPDVIELDYDLATNKLKDYSLSIEVRSEEYNDNIPANAIISQDPLPDTLIDKYSKVYVVVSKGSNKEDISNFLYQDVETVTTELRKKKYTVTRIDEYNNQFGEGIVFDINPLKPELEGPVTLKVSKGPEDKIVKVPVLLGRTEEEAIGLLADSGLLPGDPESIMIMPSDTVPAGNIISQSIAPDTEISVGSKIGYTVSSGQEVKTQSYVGSVKGQYAISDYFGPGTDGAQIDIMVRLHQVVNGEDVYTTLMEPRRITGNTIVPVKFDFIEGAYGVDTGQVEVVRSDTGEILKTFDVEFFNQ
ncbi:MAG: Stk1 family PASTA domain-containing Ser/Thr kinase [Lachnospiraceae bacterium]|nr:Stk1 family PASTA domain-containing Ser/Thr kinase [Lachnospiraceae bacterium]